MNFTGIVNIAVGFIKTHERGIKSGLKVAGVILTAVETSRVSIKAYKVVKELEKDPEYENMGPFKKTLEVCKGVGPEIAAPVILGVATSGGIILDDRQMIESQLATMALCEATRGEFDRYREATKRALGENKERTEVVANVAREDVKRAYKEVIEGTGDKLYLDAPNGRIFWSTNEKIEAGKNKMDALFNMGKCPTQNDIGEAWGLRPVENGDYMYLGADIKEDELNDITNRQFMYDIVPITIDSTDYLYQYDNVIRVIYYERSIV